MKNDREFKVMIDGKNVDFLELDSKFDFEVSELSDEHKDMLLGIKAGTISVYRHVDYTWIEEIDFIHLVALFYCLYWEPN